MSKFIRLTRLTDDEEKVDIVFVNVEQIRAFVQRENFCEVILGDSYKLLVKENVHNLENVLDFQE